MSYFGEHYPFYVPPHISGTEKVKITITKPTSTREMEQRTKMRYAFAMSSFGRMFLPKGITPEMKELCKKWSENFNEQPPIMKDLYQVDRYFLDLWRHRQQ
tara:strand:+ start:722 stop:1024 length:303 start_codon:yes stop_codon:yes gene_type:complete